MNRKAIELAISTLILIILGIFLLVGLIYAVAGGFRFFKESSRPFLDTTLSSSIKQACSLACGNSDKLTYCCREYDIENQKIKCSDSRLEIDCNLKCEGYNCLRTLEEECAAEGGTYIDDPGDGSIHERGCDSGYQLITLTNVISREEGGICCKIIID